MSNILEGEHCCGNLLQVIGGEKMIMESKDLREKIFEVETFLENIFVGEILRTGKYY